MRDLPAAVPPAVGSFSLPTSRKAAQNLSDDTAFTSRNNPTTNLSPQVLEEKAQDVTEDSPHLDLEFLYRSMIFTQYKGLMKDLHVFT